MEAALRTLLIQAIEPEYLQPLRNTHTDMINDSIPDIISFLIDTYGKLSDADMLHREQALTALVFDTTKPVEFVFNAIDEFAILMELNDSAISDRRKVQLAYVIFQKCK